MWRSGVLILSVVVAAGCGNRREAVSDVHPWRGRVPDASDTLRRRAFSNAGLLLTFEVLPLQRRRYRANGDACYVRTEKPTNAFVVVQRPGDTTRTVRGGDINASGQLLIDSLDIGRFRVTIGALGYQRATMLHTFRAGRVDSFVVRFAQMQDCLGPVS